MDSGGTPVEMLAMIDSGSNTSLLSKNAAERLGIIGTATHLTMNLAGGEKRSETSEIIEMRERHWKYTLSRDLVVLRRQSQRELLNTSLISNQLRTNSISLVAQ